MLAIVLVMFLVLLLAGFPIIVSMGIPALLYVIVEGLPNPPMSATAAPDIPAKSKLTMIFTFAV